MNGKEGFFLVKHLCGVSAPCQLSTFKLSSYISLRMPLMRFKILNISVRQGLVAFQDQQVFGIRFLSNYW
jgi:hypothetical protein